MPNIRQFFELDKCILLLISEFLDIGVDGFNQDAPIERRSFNEYFYYLYEVKFSHLFSFKFKVVLQ